MHIAHNETQSWGIEIVRTELKENGPPKDVQETVNKLVNKAGDKFFGRNTQLLRKFGVH